MRKKPKQMFLYNWMFKDKPQGKVKKGNELYFHTLNSAVRRGASIHRIHSGISISNSCFSAIHQVMVTIIN